MFASVGVKMNLGGIAKISALVFKAERQIHKTGAKKMNTTTHNPK
jgi:hypothetical protein